jgi:secondary thiamine-phosphate synthase enzyme
LHDNTNLRNFPPDERINGHAHLRSLILNSNEVIPIENFSLSLGNWQSIFFIELDGKRDREIKVTIIGE